jgi:hypothetical protein
MKTKYCKKCGIDLSTVNTIHGEEKKCLFFTRWVYLCDDCKRAEFGLFRHSHEHKLQIHIEHLKEPSIIQQMMENDPRNQFPAKSQTSID